jgi:hypothetical protein
VSAAWWVGFALALAGAKAAAQPGATLAQRVAASAGTVRFSLPARADVCGAGDERGWRIGARGGAVHARELGDWAAMPCVPGPVRVVLERADGVVMRVRTAVGGAWRPGAAGTDLGDVAATEGAAVLLSVLEGASGARLAREAIQPIVLAAGIDAGRLLLPVARDRARPREVRTAALFWVAVSAQEEIAPQLHEVAREDPDLEIRRQAVFALAQRPDDEAIPALLTIADSRRDPEVRRSAIFWLGQKDDPRVTAWFTAVLTRPD